MISIKLFSVRDLKAGTYGQAFCLHNRAVAVRTVTDWVANPQSHFGKFPEDYELYELGALDLESGKLIPLEHPEYVCRLSDLLAQAAASA